MEYSDDDKDGKWSPLGNSGVNVFVLQYMVINCGFKVVPCYIVKIHDPLQFNYIVLLLSTGLMFCHILGVVQDNRNRLSISSKISCVSEGNV